MSWILLERVALTRGIPAAQKSVLIVLAQHAHNDGTNARPSQERIAAFAGMTARNVRRCLASLEATGYIVPVLHGGPQNHTVNYSIRLDMLADNADNMSAFHSPNSDNMSAFDEDNPDISAQKGGHFRHVRRTFSTDKADILSAESGKNHVMNQKKESAERAQRASASFVSSFENQKEARDQNPEQSIHTLLAPYDDNEWMALEGDAPLADERGVLLTLCAMTEEASPHRAWLQHVPTFLEAHATPDQLLIGFSMMREQFATMEHKPGVRKLAEHWDEWQSRAKAHIAKIIAEEAYFAEQQRRNLALEEAEERGREIRRAEQARRAALTPEERAQEDAENAAIEQAYKEQEARRHAERMAYMRAATAPRVVEVS